LPWTLRMTLYAFAIVILPYILVGWRLNTAIKFLFPEYKRLTKRLIISLFVFLNLLPFIILILFIFGDIRDYVYQESVSWFDYLFVFPFWIGFLTIFELFFYFLALDFLQYILGKVFKDKKEILSNPMSYFRIILFTLFFIYVSVTCYRDTYTVRIASYDVKLKNIPAELEGLNLALIGDVQIDRYTQNTKIDNFHRKLNQVDPDILLFAGDLVTRGTHFIPQGVNVLCDTEAKIERVACVGDHDVWSSAGMIANGLVKCGWTFLDNKHHSIEYKGRKILVTGITYVYSRRANPGQLEELLKNAPQSDLKILLVHQPSQMVINAAEKHKYDILLAGHTHGGQIVFKPFGFSLTPTMFENSYYSGRYQLNALNLFVTNGIGLTMMPLRFRAPAEIQQIRIQGND
jgi:predicted MPP superfamily phosphohydrolase